MFPTPVSSGLTFGKVISGISKTLSIANQVIPLYKEAKPMINNARTIMSVLKGINSSNNQNSNYETSNKQIENNSNKKEQPVPIKYKNTPRFFL